MARSYALLVLAGICLAGCGQPAAVSKGKGEVDGELMPGIGPVTVVRKRDADKSKE